MVASLLMKNQFKTPLPLHLSAELGHGDAKTTSDGDQFIVSHDDRPVLNARNGGLIELHSLLGDTPGQISLRHRGVVKEPGLANSTACQVLI